MQNLSSIVSSVVKEELLKLDEIVCSICLEIYLSPVTLPCKHTFCLSCLHSTLKSHPKVCPMCRNPMNNFLPNNVKLESLVDLNLWNRMRDQFPHAVKRRVLGLEDGLSDIAFLPVTNKVSVEEPGSIRKEYELEMLAALKEKEEREKRKVTDEKESLMLLEIILMEDARASNAPKPILQQLRIVRQNLEDLNAKEASNNLTRNNEQPSTSSGVMHPGLPRPCLCSDTKSNAQDNINEPQVTNSPIIGFDVTPQIQSVAEEPECIAEVSEAIVVIPDEHAIPLSSQNTGHPSPLISGRKRKISSNDSQSAKRNYNLRPRK